MGSGSPDGGQIIYRTVYRNQPGTDELLASPGSGGDGSTIAGPPLTPGRFDVR